MDVRNVAQFSPGHWTFDAVRFGYEHLIDRLEAGMRFRDQEDLDEARTAVSEAWTIASRRIPSAAERDRLAVLRDRILSLMAGAG